jgi:hypothetical protein
MRKALALVLLVACGGEDVPSCQQAVSHYYGAGCVLLATNGQPYPEIEIVNSCKELLATSPSRACDEALEDLRICFGSVPSPASGNADCDCTREQDAILTCR